MNRRRAHIEYLPQARIVSDTPDGLLALYFFALFPSVDGVLRWSAVLN